jgi:segregation and condensation protein B
MSHNPERIKHIIEAALMAAGQPLSVDRLLSLFLDEQQPTREEIRQALTTLQAECAQRGVELVEISSGFRFQSKQEYAPWIARLWEEKPPRYSRAMLETLALIAYRQPITRGEIEDVRGVTVTTNIIKTLEEREWIKVVGHRDVPGKPAMYATTRQFLDYFNLKSLNDLPTLAQIRDIDTINAELDLLEPGQAPAGESAEAGDLPLDLAPGDDAEQDTTLLLTGKESSAQASVSLASDDAADEDAVAVRMQSPDDQDAVAVSDPS